MLFDKYINQEIDMTDIEILEKRVANLERVVFGLWSIIEDIQPPYIQDGGNEIMQDFFSSSLSLGGFRSFEFQEIKS